MKLLFLLRHAKSSWTDARLSDFERPLNERGRIAAPFMGELMARHALSPDVIVASPATRAAQTAGLVREASGSNAEVRSDERIYEASPNTLRQVIADFKDSLDSAMLVGHNPGMEGLIRYLTDQIEPMPTAALAVIKLKIENWNEIRQDCGKIVTIYRPKDEMQSDRTF